jgi:hypothetical protein
MEFVRPIVEERFAKMEEFGEDWDDAPVRQVFCLSWHLFMRSEYRMIC